MRGSFTGGPVPYFSPIEIAFVRTVPVSARSLGHTICNGLTSHGFSPGGLPGSSSSRRL